MKRLYEYENNAIYYEAGEDMDNIDMDSIDMERLMAYLSYREKAMLSYRKTLPRVFECKTCNRRFPTFQALGGHRASHKKPRLAEDGSPIKPKTHECSVCGLEFAVGQALGGHMRRHRPMGIKKQELLGDEKRKLFGFDLNEPASSEEEEEISTTTEEDCHSNSGVVGLGHDRFDYSTGAITSPIVAVDCVL